MSNDSPTSALSALPLETVTDIFVVAAASSEESASAISLVCSWAHSIVAQDRFKTRILRVRRGVANRMPPPETVAPLVRNLWMENITVNWMGSIPFFRAMQYVERIALPGFILWSLLEAIKEDTAGAAEPAVGGLVTPLKSPYRNCCSLYVLDDGPTMIWKLFTQLYAGREFLNGLTHIRLHSIIINGLIPIHEFPNVTHIAFPVLQLQEISMSSERMNHILDTFLPKASLQKIVLTVVRPRVPPPYDLVDFALADLPAYVESRQDRFPVKIIHIAFSNAKVSIDEWKEEVSGGKSIWKSAVPFDTMLDGSYFAELEVKGWAIEE